MPVPNVPLAGPSRAIDRTIAPDDEMFDRHRAPADADIYYHGVGWSALMCVRLGLVAAGTPTVRRILDYPCGHGRVLRVLAAYHPDATCDVGDLNQSGVNFCVQQLGATPVVADRDPAKVKLNPPYDLIWVGSLLTHLPASEWPGFLKLFRAALHPDGVCVMTTHGHAVADRVRADPASYGVTNAKKLLAGYDTAGFGYAPYANSAEYGISLSKPGWVADAIRAAGGIVYGLRERGWADHQDSVAWGPSR